MSGLSRTRTRTNTSPSNRTTHMQGGSMFVHSKAPDRFWSVEGLPGKKLKQLEKEFQADTMKSVADMKKLCMAEAQAMVARQQTRDLVLSQKMMDDALEAQRKLYERRLAVKEAELQEQLTLVMALTASSAGSYGKAAPR